MEQVRILPFHWSHALVMDLREQERRQFELLPDFLDRLKYQTTHSVAFSAFDGDIVACSWGLIPMWPGVWELWLLSTFHVERRAHVFARAAIRTIDAICIRDDVSRLQIVVKCADLRAVRFAKCLRFVSEGVMSAYGPDGSDYFMMARVRHGSDVRRRREQAAGADAGAADGPAPAAAGED